VEDPEADSGTGGHNRQR